MEERVTAQLFSPEFARRVISRKQFVRFRIPPGVIGAAQNGAQLVYIFAQDHIEAATKLRRLDFAPMPLAHGRDLVGTKNSAFEKIEFPKKLDSAESDEALVQVGLAKIKSPEASLLRDVM